MTTFNTYNFMDLLKDHNYVPSVRKSSSTVINEVASLFETVASKFDVSTDEYGFMDLVKEKSYSFSPIQVVANDNRIQFSDAA